MFGFPTSGIHRGREQKRDSAATLTEEKMAQGDRPAAEEEEAAVGGLGSPWRSDSFVPWLRLLLAAASGSVVSSSKVKQMANYRVRQKISEISLRLSGHDV